VEENKDILMSLLNSIVSEDDQIDQVELLNPYNERNFKQDKLSVIDIKARNKHNNTYFLIEMQLAEEIDYPKRGLYGWARVYSNQISSGDNYKQLNKTIAIHILNFTFIDYSKEVGWIETSPSKYHHRFVLIDKDSKVEIFKDIEIHTIELNKFEAINDEDIDVVMLKVKDMLDTWVAVLTKYDLLNITELPDKINMPVVQKALKVMHEMNLSKEEREIYDSHLDFLRIEEGAFEARFEAGRAVGEKNKELAVADAVAAGEKQKAIAVAEAIAVTEKNKEISIAKKMFLKGSSVEDVIELTNLSLEEIEVIQRKA
jgi:predicted transposase/invertase (TIGR01784 family)